jgi:hypothetical protein
MKRGRKLFTVELLVQRGIFPENWKEVLIEIGRGGGNKTDMMIAMDVNKETFLRLMDRSTDFMETVNKALRLSEQWWMDITKKEWIAGNSKSINSNHWSLIMRNMFKDNWSDRKDVDITTKGDKIDNVRTFEVEIVKTVTNENKGQEKGDTSDPQ